MMLNYYLAWLHFDKWGRMATRLPEGHRVLHVLHSSSSNLHPPALWVVIEAVAASPAYTPAAGFPASYGEPQPPVEYRRPTGPQAPVPGPQFRSASGPQPQADDDPAVYQEVYARHFGNDQPPASAAQNGGRTQYPELSPTSLDTRDDDYRSADSYRADDYASGVSMSPVNR